MSPSPTGAVQHHHHPSQYSQTYFGHRSAIPWLSGHPLPHLCSSNFLPGPSTSSSTWFLLSSKECICHTHRASAISRKSQSEGSPNEPVWEFERNKEWWRRGINERNNNHVHILLQHKLSHCQLRSSHGRGIYIAAIMSLKLPQILEQEATYPCCSNFQLWNLKSHKEEILPPTTLTKAKREQGIAVGEESTRSTAILTHTQPLPITAETWLCFLVFSKGAIGADALITSESQTCFLRLLAKVWQKCCRNLCLERDLQLQAGT